MTCHPELVEGWDYMFINCRGNLIDLSTPKVMGILNVTPDSFFDGGRYTNVDSAVDHAKRMVEEGATFIDIGGQSTRPGAKRVEIEEEWSRVSAILKRVRKESDTLISIDTFYSEIARRAIEEGADIINDVSGGTMDNEMFQVIARLKVPYVLMHTKGTPEDMQQHATYHDVVTEVIDYFAEKTRQLNSLGVVDIILDPGFGFAKTAEHNYELLYKLDLLGKFFNRPVLAGMSRKSMVSKSLSGTMAVNTVALLKGASILRVHDVKEAVETIKIVARLSPSSAH